MPRRSPLSHESVVEAAAAVADEGGLHAVSMRSVGRHLGVEAMSLYHHVDSKSSLLDDLADWVISRVELPQLGTPWRPAMVAFAASTRAVYTRHPWAISLIESRATPGPAILRHHDRVLGCLVRDDFSIALASHAFSAIDAYVFGFVITELQLPFEAGDEEEFGTALALPADEYPYLVSLITDLVVGKPYDYGDEFGYGLELLLDQLEVRLASEPARSKPAPAAAAEPDAAGSPPHVARACQGECTDARQTGAPMSFQAYLDAVETKTGLTPRQLVELATERDFGPGTKAAPILEWLKTDYDLGRGHGMAIVHVITKGDQISSKHVGSGGTHADESDRLWLDGKDSKPADW